MDHKHVFLQSNRLTKNKYTGCFGEPTLNPRWLLPFAYYPRQVNTGDFGMCGAEKHFECLSPKKKKTEMFPKHPKAGTTQNV